MRISAQSGIDRAAFDEYCRLRRKGTVLVYLDDERQKSVITADDSTGEILRHVLDKNDRVQRDPRNNGQALTERVRGDVRILVV